MVTPKRSAIQRRLQTAPPVAPAQSPPANVPDRYKNASGEVLPEWQWQQIDKGIRETPTGPGMYNGSQVAKWNFGQDASGAIHTRDQTGQILNNGGEAAQQFFNKFDENTKNAYNWSARPQTAPRSIQPLPRMYPGQTISNRPGGALNIPRPNRNNDLSPDAIQRYIQELIARLRGGGY